MNINAASGDLWAEAKIKALTDGDPISARFMRQDFFTYVPEFKLFVAGNHKPSLRTVDPAVRRRFNLVPFTVQIPEAEQDTELPENLKTEWPAILRWAIEGCLEPQFPKTRAAIMRPRSLPGWCNNPQARGDGRLRLRGILWSPL